jgi:hypothetical protein
VAALSVVFALTSGAVGLDWGLPFHWHPDEKVPLAIDMLERHSADPQYFVNPAFHVYIVTAAVWLADEFTSLSSRTAPATGGPAEASTTAAEWALRSTEYRWGRAVSVLSAGLAVAWLWGSLIGVLGEWAAALAALGLAASMGLANVAHFATPEALSILVNVGTMSAIVSLARRGRPRDAVAAGIGFGLACSTKYTAILIAGPLAWVVASLYFSRGPRVAVARGAVAAAVSFAAFCFTTPYAMLHWQGFQRGGVHAAMEAGAPINSLALSSRTWGAYGAHLANAMGWPLFAVALAGLAAFAWRSRAAGHARGALAVHAVWIVAFWGFLGQSPLAAMRFILPILPSLAVFAGWGAELVIRRPSGAAGRRAAVAAVAAVYVYSAAYCATGVSAFLQDTRYRVKPWLRRHLVYGVGVTTFAPDTYLPTFDPQSYDVHFRNEVWPSYATREEFEQWRRDTFNAMNDVIVDSSFLYLRFYDEPNLRPGRLAMYHDLFAGADPSGYRLVADFVWRGWPLLRPVPEMVAPRIVVFAKPGQTYP